LDCSSVTSATETLAVVLGISTSELVGRLRAFDDEAYRRDHPEEFFWYENVLASEVLPRRADDIAPPDEVVWFHATRVPRESRFQSEGLLPLRDCIDGLRRDVTLIARDLGIAGSEGTISGSFAAKRSRLEVQGPSASLLRDAAVNPGTTHRNFLESPEIVEDIAMEIGGPRFEEILARYKAKTTPCLVSFRSEDARPDVVVRALAYLHSTIRGGSDPVFWNTCFDGEGRRVPPADIVQVEWLPS
jgi:hypothetical protein